MVKYIDYVGIIFYVINIYIYLYNVFVIDICVFLKYLF